MGKTINVSNAAQLAAAIRTVKGGETILLAAGDYGTLSIIGRMLAETVTIRSADPANDARIANLRVNGSSNFRIEDIDLNRPLAKGEALYTQAAYISNSSKIDIVGVDFRGSMDGNAANDATALRVTGSSAVSVTGSTFEQWGQAGLFSGSTGLTLSGNRVTDVVKTFSLTTLKNSLVADNSFVGVKPEWGAQIDGVTLRNNHVVGVDVVGGIETGIGKSIAVANAAQLAAAVAAVKGGETILLAPGNYGELTVKNRMLDTTVTIKSADAANDAVLSGIRVHASSGFRFDDLDVKRPLLAGEADWTQAVYVSASKAIDLVRIDFTGSLDNNPWNDGVAVRVGETQGFRLIDSTFEQFNIAAKFANVDRLVVAGNTVTDVREGFNFAAVQDVTIAQNRLFGFDPNYAKGDHSDAIQFWNAGVDKGSSRVVIRDNIILQGANGGTQGIFIGSEDPTKRHSDFTIENNLYNGDARHGISIYGVDGAVIRGNTVTTAVGGYLETAININRSTNVLVENNISPLLLQSAGNANVTLRGNIDLWDRSYKTGVSLEQIFEAPVGGMFSENQFVARGAGGFHGFHGIGAAAFDLNNAGSVGQVGALLQTLMIA